MKFPIILTIILILCSFSVLGLGEIPYPTSGQSIGGTSLFNANLGDDVSAVARSVTDPRLQPLVGDLDNDGTNEIVVIGGQTLNIFQDSNLTIKTGTSALNTIDHAILYDIDGDDTLEIITTGGSYLTIFDFNGTSLSLTSNFTMPYLSADTENFMIGCRGADDCLLVTAPVSYGVPSVESLYVARFTSNGIYNNTAVKTNINNGDWYLPRIRCVSTADYDEDGITEFIFTAFGYANGYLCTWWVNTNAQTGITEEYEECISTSYINTDANRDEFTCPSVYDYDIGGAGLETVIAYQEGGTDDFEIRIFDSGMGDSDIDTIDTHYTVFNDGHLISNIMRVNAFGDTSDTDYCALGIDLTDDEMVMICGSQMTGSFLGMGDTASFEYSGSLYYDLSDEQYLYVTSSMAIQAVSTTTSGSNLDEILTPYGVFYIDYDGDDELLPLYDIPYSDGSAISSDVEQVGRDDILFLSNSGLLWYIDDGFVNQGGEIDEWEVDPCDAVWKVNTSVGITLKLYDDEGDLVQGRVILYEGDANEQDTGWTANVSSGSTVNFFFDGGANQTGIGTLSLYARDSENPTINDSVNIPFSVGTDGVEFGDCTQSGDETTSADEEEEEDAQTRITGEGLTDAEIEQTIGILWTSNSRLKLLLGIIIVILIMVRVASWTHNGMAILAGGVLGLILASALTLVSTYMMVLVLVALALLAILGNKIMGTDSNGGG